MKIRHLMKTTVATALVISATAANAQSGFGPWTRFRHVDGVNIEYAIKDEQDGFRVAWRCTNVTSRRLSCSIGAGENKRYICYDGSIRLGTTGALGERAGVAPGGTYTFPSEPACRGKGATSVQPFALISIEE